MAANEKTLDMDRYFNTRLLFGMPNLKILESMTLRAPTDLAEDLLPNPQAVGRRKATSSTIVRYLL